MEFEDKFDFTERLHYYYKKEKLENGQTVEIRFVEEANNHYWVEFCVYTKRKHKDSNMINVDTTGTLGLIPMLWAKKQIKAFKQIPKTESVIIVHWADNRRRNIYHRRLSELGFYFATWCGMKVLLCKIELDKTKI